MLRRKPVYYIPNGIRVPSSRIVQDRAGPPRHLAFVGRLAPEKRPDLFLRVTAELTREFPDLRATVMGSGPLAGALRSLAQELRIDDICTFTGLVDDVERRLRAVDVLVSLSDSEGTPRAVLEAMSQGVTVVATGVGGVPDLITDGSTGILVPAGPAAAAAAVTAIRSVLADPARLHAIGRAAGQSLRSGFHVESMADQVRAVYDSVLSSRPDRLNRGV
jgi:glycosyltransferase involved in cell wall biosynthesis